MIEIRNVSRRYGSVQALKNVDLRVEKGSVLGLLGQNGAGKTTLLNLLTGYLAPTEGQVLLDGFDPLLQPQQAKRRLGYLPEQPPLYDEMTVEEYLHFVCELRGVAAHGIRAHAQEIMELTGLTVMRRRLIGHLSKGYRQRTGMAQALCGDPAVLVLDEPTVGLDPKQVTEMRALIRKLSHRRTIVFSSHILSEVQQLCTRVVILDRGEVRLDQPMDSVGQGEEITLKCTFAAGENEVKSALRGLDGMRRFTSEPLGENRCTAMIVFHGAPEPEARLFSLCASRRLLILHLSRCEDSLETVFLNVIAHS